MVGSGVGSSRRCGSVRIAKRPSRAIGQETGFTAFRMAAPAVSLRIRWRHLEALEFFQSGNRGLGQSRRAERKWRIGRGVRHIGVRFSSTPAANWIEKPSRGCPQRHVSDRRASSSLDRSSPWRCSATSSPDRAPRGFGHGSSGPTGLCSQRSALSRGQSE